MSDDSSIIVNTKGGNGVETKTKEAQRLAQNQNHRNPCQYNYVCSTTASATFNHRFLNVHQIQSPTLDTGEATALWEKFQKIKHNLLKISALFCHLFILCLMILLWIVTTLPSHFKEKRKRKRKLAPKFGVLTPYRRQSFCYWYYRERLKNFIFLLLTPISIILFFEIIHRPFGTKTL